MGRFTVRPLPQNSATISPRVFAPTRYVTSLRAYLRSLHGELRLVEVQPFFSFCSRDTDRSQLELAILDTWSHCAIKLLFNEA